MRRTKLTRVLSLVMAFVLLLGVLPTGGIARAVDEASLDAEQEAITTASTEEATAPNTEPEAEAEEDTEPATTEPTAEDTTVAPEEATEEATDAATETAPETEGTEATGATEPAETEATELAEHPAADILLDAMQEPMLLDARASNYLNVWGEYVFNGSTMFQLGNLWSYGIKRLDFGGTPAFCIEPTIEAASAYYDTKDTIYAINKLGNDKFRAITLAIAYGWPMQSYANTNTGYSIALGGNTAMWQETEKWTATQVIVWEIALGYRNATWPYARTNAYLYNKCAAPYSSWTNFEKVYNEIAIKMAKHNQFPSFCAKTAGAAPTYKMTYDSASGNYKLTLTDKNGVLSGYTVKTNISGVTFKQSGSTLTITATPAGAQALKDGVSCRMENSSILDVDSDRVVTVWGLPGKQTVVTPIYGQVDPARAYFKLEAEATSTAKVIKKNSEAGGRIANFTFELRDSAGTVLDTKVTDANGNLAFSTALTVGATYVIHEVPANGFVVQPDQEFTAQRGENVVTFVNTRSYGGVQVVKVDAETGERLSGAAFRVYQDSNGNGILDDIDLVSATPVREDSENPGVYNLYRLSYGKYHLRETAAPEGYVLDETVYNFEIVEDGETVVVESSAGSGTFENQKIYGSIQGLKIDHQTGEPISGALFGLFAADETVFTEGTALMTAVSNEDGIFTFDHVAYGRYVVRELKPAEGYLPNEEIYPVTVDEDGETIEITVVNDRIPRIHTNATVGGMKEIGGADIITIDDEVAYVDLIPGKEYTISGVLMNKATGSPLLIDGKEILNSVTFTPEEKDGTVVVSFSFDARKIQTETEIVAFESLTRDGIELAVHADLEDGGQTVTVTPPEIHTTATVDGEKQIGGADIVTLDDEVAYENLIPGKEYKLSGILMDKATGEPLLIGGEEVTSEVTFTPEEATGTVVVSFSFDAREIKQETEIVAFESLERDGVGIAIHADLEDGGQTVTVTPPEIHTTATVDGAKTVTTNKPVTMKDIVVYKDLIPGKEYAIKGVLMNKATGKAFLVDGKEITAETTFTPDMADGEVEMTFTFESKGITKSTEIVAFESLLREGVEIAVHADINDEGQTVTITPPQTPPNTGDSSNLVLWASLLTLTLMALAGIAVLTLRKKN